jgi:hypothetical protein
MMAILTARGGNAGLRVRSTITTILLIMIAVMIVRDILARRRNRLSDRSQSDSSFVVRWRGAIPSRTTI